MSYMPTNKAAGASLQLAFAAARVYYRLRYRRLTLGSGVRIAGRLRIRGSIRVSIGENCRLARGVKIDGEGELVVGARTLLNGPWIHSDCSITIGEECLIAGCEIVDTDFHNVPPETRHGPLHECSVGPIVIERNVWVGGGAIVLKGVSIGQGSVIGAGTVVRRDVPELVVVIGNPQQIVKRLAPAGPSGPQE